MDEIISTQISEISEHFEEFIENRAFIVTVDGCADEARKFNFSFLTRNRTKGFLFTLEALAFEVFGTNRERGELKEGATAIERLFQTLQCDALRILVR